MRGLADAPHPVQGGDNLDVFVSVVDGTFVLGESEDEDYMGWIKALANVLMCLYWGIGHSKLLPLVYVLEERDSESFFVCRLKLLKAEFGALYLYKMIRLCNGAKYLVVYRLSR